MSADQLWQAVVVLLGGGLLGTLGTWLTTKHRPQVDRAQTAVDGFDKLTNRMQAHMDDQDEQIKSLTTRVERAENRAAAAEEAADEARRVNTYAVAENAQLVRYLQDTVAGMVEGKVPPWLDPRDYELHARLSVQDFPVIRHHDTGVPGVDINPPT